MGENIHAVSELCAEGCLRVLMRWRLELPILDDRYYDLKRLIILQSRPKVIQIGKKW